MDREGAEVPEIEWCVPGEDAGIEVLMGNKDGFLTKRLKNYSTDRNNPIKPKALSGLSPYLHFGQVSAQRCALEARKVRNTSPQVHIPTILLNVYTCVVFSVCYPLVTLLVWYLHCLSLSIKGGRHILGRIDCAKRTLRQFLLLSTSL